CVLALHTVSTIYEKAADRELVIYTGLPGSDCHIVGTKLQKALSTRFSAYGGLYRVRLEEKNGADAKQENVRRDTNGSAVGFAQDEHGNAPDALVVAPLEIDYLHVIVGPTMLERIAGIRSQPHLVGQVVNSPHVPESGHSTSAGNSSEDPQKQCAAYW